ncbi:Smr/MutS family protein [Methylocapsa aurea]|uniref:Smr/MutS family protein n=1 Tax=Methylocapsa aurea TaxID=663610 RepID=UPI0005691C22|nr:Smr/MutS family protein [Methylocapsa aurea]
MKENSASFGNGRLRRLSAEEIELWLAVTRSVAPRAGRHLPDPPQMPAPMPNGVSGSPEGAEPKSIIPGQKPDARQKPAVRPPIPPLAPLERRLRQKLSRGRAAPDAAIDLHGMRRQEAFSALHQFLLGAQREGARLVLVVTGKGERGPSEDGTAGVLRRSVPQWLRGPEYHSIVVGFEEATRPHGGAGALYVRIRRRDRARGLGG